MTDDVYIVTIYGGYAGPVTIIEPEYASRAISQLRSGGRKVKVFRDRDEYLAFLEHDAAERRKNALLQMSEMAFTECAR